MLSDLRPSWHRRGLGNADDAFRYLEMARKQQESFLIFARVAKLYGPIRSDPGFPALLTRIGLSDQQLHKNLYSTSEGHH